MENPKDEIICLRKEDLLAKSMRQLEACRRGLLNVQTRQLVNTSARPSDSDEDRNSGPDYKGMNLYMKQIYKKYVVNDQHRTTNPLNAPDDQTNPPTLPLSQEIYTAFGDFAQWVAAQTHNTRAASPPSLVIAPAEVKHTLGEYLDFIGISSLKCKEVLHTLLQNNIDNYKTFKSVSHNMLQV
ncbi:hypothetical protein PCASD_10092 [Puccinia coronata f. sp. avenae]|uniref:Uncharacterized protein n=1 Tax=Puccinia coronata f. sp. avenae TaxID=200324 RepID=A0A2N5UW68_9BASI|nr:hypothetical protein PCASD_10092 [Puccinia coronata f. sp. avenae]